MYVLLYRTNVLFDYLIFKQYEVIKNDEKKDSNITDTTPCNDYEYRCNFSGRYECYIA